MMTVYIVAVAAGRTIERWTGLILAAGLVLANVTHAPTHNSPQYATFVIDLATLVVLTVFMLRSQRRWLLWAVAYQLLAILAHVVRFSDPAIHGWAYLSAVIAFGYGVTVALGIGVIEARRWGSTAAACRVAPT